MLLFSTPGCAVLLLIDISPFGPVHTVFTTTETSTAGLNTTMQVRVTLDPIGRMGFDLLLVTATEDGDGTKGESNSVILLFNN